MSVFVFCGLALLGGVTAVILRALRPDFAVLAGLVTALLLLGISLSSLASVIETLRKIASHTGFAVYTGVILKTLGIGILSQLTSDVCRECGASAVAAKVELAAKILILGLCLPLLETLLGYIEGFLE